MKWLLSIPLHLVATGLTLAIAYLVVWLLGWREYTTILSGTFATENEFFDGLRAVAYLSMYFGSIVLAPIFVIAAGVLVMLERVYLKPIAAPTTD